MGEQEGVNGLLESFQVVRCYTNQENLNQFQCF